MRRWQSSSERLLSERRYQAIVIALPTAEPKAAMAATWSMLATHSGSFSLAHGSDGSASGSSASRGHLASRHVQDSVDGEASSAVGVASSPRSEVSMLTHPPS